MDTNDFEDRFRKECSKAEHTAKTGNREQCRKFMEFLKDQMKTVSSGQIKSNFKLKNLKEAINWYTIFIYSGYENYSKESKLSAMFSIIVEYIATHSSPELHHKLARDILQREIIT